MSLNLIDLVSKEFSGDLLGKIASSLGEPEQKVKTAVGGAAPALVAALASKGSTGIGLTDIVDLLRNGGFDGSRANGLAGMLGGGSSLTDLVTRGAPMVASLLGNRQTDVVRWLASMAGIAPRSATALLGLAAPTVLSLLGGHLRNAGGLTQSGLSQILGEQKNLLRNGAPVGLASALGLSDFSALGVTPRAAAAVPATRSETNWWPWVAPLLLAALAGWWWLGWQPAGTLDAQSSMVADAIYAGGNIVTVNDAQPTAEAVAVKDGKIVAVGTRADVEKAHKGPATRAVDLAGRTLVPGFVDGHAHFAAFGSQAVGANLLAPPDGTVNTIDDLVARLREFGKGPDVGRTGWIFGLGYDDALLGRHPDRDDLDKVSKDVPVIAVHISGHFSAMNSAGLAKVGYTAATKNPEGGVIRRRPGTQEPNGVLEELASIPHMVPAINATKPEDKDYFVKKGLELAKSFGYTTINEGRAFGFQQKDLVDQAGRGLFDIDVQSYIDYTDRKILDAEFSKTYRNRFRAAGMKITLDGSPQGRTAWRTFPYLIPPDGQKPGYKGYPAMPDTTVIQGLFDEAYQKGWPTKVHANGDAAVDQMIAALKPIHAKYGPGDRRHVLIHGQFVRKDQLDALKELQVIPSLFPMHSFYWGDWYDKIIGPELAAQISPMRSAIDRGMMPTSHTDAPVALPNLVFVAYATVNRVTRSGKIQGPQERVTPLEALKAITLWSARQHFEEATKGSLEVGKLADFAILDGNPLTVDPTTINKIVVIETIKEGRSVYTRR